MTILNEEKKYRELKESIRMMNSHRSDAEKVNLIEEGKKIGIMLLSNCAICISSEKSRFIKNQEAKGLLSNLGLKTPLSKVPILDDILF